MRLFDTHCHFEASDPAEIAAILSRAREAGVERIMAVGGSPSLNAAAIMAAEVSKGKRKKEEGKSKEGGSKEEGWCEGLPAVLCAAGFDRDQINVPRDTSSPSPSPSSSFPLPSSPSPSPLPSSLSLSAVGEIGLDYHYSPETRDAQRRLFAEQLEVAARRNLPVVIHTREAADDTIAILREIPSRGIIHCFTGTPAEAKSYLDLGFYVSISGIVTFRAADNVRESALVVPDDRILIETDSPFLAPVPLRGRRNEPAFIRHTCEFLARLRGVSADDFAALTFANAEAVLLSRPAEAPQT